MRGSYILAVVCDDAFGIGSHDNVQSVSFLYVPPCQAAVKGAFVVDSCPFLFVINAMHVECSIWGEDAYCYYIKRMQPGDGLEIRNFS